MSERLPNGIELPENWPPRNQDSTRAHPVTVPWLEKPPAVLPIDLGRQLFVDDFLIEQTTLEREFHFAQKFDGNPILQPETDLEKTNNLPLAGPKSGGVWWDPADQLFKMWYEAGWLGASAYATSKDGLRWERPLLDIVPGTNRLVPELRPDSSTVWLDHDTPDASQRFKMFLRPPDESDTTPAYALVSADGIHWSSPQISGFAGDRSTFFLNPFRQKWVFSLRFLETTPLKQNRRIRRYHEHSDFLKGAKWESNEPVFWACADELDPPLPDIGQAAQLYNLDAVAYESLLIGLFEIHRGPTNEECMKTGAPKATDLTLGFSRDGFHWHRPERTPFISGTRKEGDWDRGYVQSVGGVCTVVGEELRFYYIGFRGDAENPHPDWKCNGMYANGSTGLARLRRDGFASMNAGQTPGTLTTRPLTFSGKRLFVNVDNLEGELTIEILDEADRPIPSFRFENCHSLKVNSTCIEVRWSGVEDLSSLRHQIVKFRFRLTSGRLYAFWLSDDDSGKSGGYVAAGGPSFTGSRDV